ncbi:hypothetical protein GCM10011363_35680 [Marivita lacus]|uniref:Uncharacterized protein n=1 Tax=Marivita lacus TaxID=1323742 RepID=A0ABQ1L4N3_9RHOB|nr:hypothetical protein GCM10011363_35680 [Marivita lacus]
MGQVRHGSASTTHAVRAAIQRSQASLAQLSKELGINPKTIAKGFLHPFHIDTTRAEDADVGELDLIRWERPHPIHQPIKLPSFGGACNEVRRGSMHQAYITSQRVGPFIKIVHAHSLQNGDGPRPDFLRSSIVQSQAS